MDVLLAQHVEEVVGVFAGPVIEGEGDDLAVARAVGDQAGAAAGAADRAHRSQAEDAVAARRQARRPRPSPQPERFSIARQR